MGHGGTVPRILGAGTRVWEKTAPASLLGGCVSQRRCGHRVGEGTLNCPFRKSNPDRPALGQLVTLVTTEVLGSGRKRFIFTGSYYRIK
jgi:hypothetical protein